MSTPQFTSIHIPLFRWTCIDTPSRGGVASLTFPSVRFPRLAAAAAFIAAFLLACEANIAAITSALCKLDPSRH